MFAEDNFIFDENGRKLSKQEENPVGKGEIARYEPKLNLKGVIVWEWVNCSSSVTQKVSLCGNGFIVAQA